MSSFRPTARDDVGGRWDDGRVTIQTSELIGRDAELSQLADVFADVATGRPRIAVIGGEAGIGKTRLLTDFLENSTPGARVLIGRCVDLGGTGDAYTAITAALRPLVAELGAEEIARITGQRALGALFPQLGRVEAGGATAGGLHESIALVLERAAADRPVVLVIEDLHWIDPASLAVLRFLSRALVDAPVLLAITYRTEDIGRGHHARSFLAELSRDRRAVRVDLPRLDREGTRRLMRALLGDSPSDSAVDALLERSDGVPFYIEELIDLETCDDVPPSLSDGLRDLLLVRYERLSDEAQHVVRHMAIGGLESDHDLLAAVLGQGAAAIEGPVSEAIGAGLLVATSNGYCFRHALMREAIHDDVLPGVRERLHERYAVGLERRAGDTGSDAAAIARHWAGAKDVGRAFPAWLRAMREARAALGYASAAEHAQRALSLWDVVDDPEAASGMTRRELMGRAATYLRNAGDVDRSLALLKAALADCPPGTREYALLLNNQGRGLAMLARPGAIESYREALATLDGLEETPEHEVMRADVMVSLAGRLMLAGEDAEALALSTAGAEIAHAQRAARLESVSVNVAALCHGHMGRADLAVSELERARAIAGDDGPAMLRYWVNASDLAHHRGEYERALRIAQEGMDAARRYGADRTSGVILTSNAVDPLTALGRWDDATELIERALAFSPPGAFRSYLIRARAWMLVWRGEAAAAREALSASRAQFTSTAEYEVQSRLGVGHAATEIALALDDLPTAWNAAQALLTADPERLHPGQVPPFAWSTSRLLTRLRERGAPPGVDLARAEAGLRRVVDGFSWWPTHEVWDAAITAQLTPSPAAWAAAVEAASGERAPVYLLPAVLRQSAACLLDDGDRAAARDRLEQAIRLADERGVLAVAREARDLGRSSGLLREPAARLTADDLTDRERQVLELVSAGLSNRQIGERLFISGKTASVHVSAILRKLGAANRAEAAHLARDLIAG